MGSEMCIRDRRRRLLARVVGPDDLDEAAVTRRAAVGRDDAVLRLLGLADSGEAQLLSLIHI